MGMAADPNRPDEMYAAVEIGGLIEALMAAKAGME